MGLIEDRIKDLGYILPDSVAPVANYVSTVKVEGQTGSNSGLVFTSGHVPRNEDGSFKADDPTTPENEAWEEQE